MAALEFTKDPDIANTGRRIRGLFPRKDFGALMWGNLRLAVTRLEDNKFVAQESIPPEWRIIQAAERIEIQELERWRGLPEGREQQTQRSERSFKGENSLQPEGSRPPSRSR